MKEIPPFERLWVCNDLACKFPDLAFLIDNNDAELSRLNDNLNSPEVFSDYIKITEIQNRIEALKKENDGYTEEWLTLQEELETLKEEYENK